nr:hypothetical protein CFP56_15843 [Quercus suber]
MAPKATFNRKNNTKDDRLSKKGTGQLIREKQRKALSSPPPPRHGAGKGLMTGKGLIAPSPIQRLVTYKDYAIEMVSSIIKETDMDPYGEHSSKDLGAFGLYNLSRELMAKTKALAEETHQLIEAEKAKTNSVTKLAAFYEQMEKARVDAVAEFRISQPFFDACGIYYGDGLEDYLK